MRELRTCLLLLFLSRKNHYPSLSADYTCSFILVAQSTIWQAQQLPVQSVTSFSDVLSSYPINYVQRFQKNMGSTSATELHIFFQSFINYKCRLLLRFSILQRHDCLLKKTAIYRIGKCLQYHTHLWIPKKALFRVYQKRSNKICLICQNFTWNEIYVQRIVKEHVDPAAQRHWSARAGGISVRAVISVFLFSNFCRIAISPGSRIRWYWNSVLS